MAPAFKEFRCCKCAKLLFKGALVDSAIEVKCKGCHELNTFQGEASSKYMCLIEPCPNRVSMDTRNQE